MIYLHSFSRCWNKAMLPMVGWKRNKILFRFYFRNVRQTCIYGTCGAV